jgi:hypothetical protein
MVHISLQNSWPNYIGSNANMLYDAMFFSVCSKSFFKRQASPDHRYDGVVEREIPNVSGKYIRNIMPVKGKFTT